jgi:hypothetical protein
MVGCLMLLTCTCMRMPTHLHTCTSMHHSDNSGTVANKKHYGRLATLHTDHYTEFVELFHCDYVSGSHIFQEKSAMLRMFLWGEMSHM